MPSLRIGTLSLAAFTGWLAWQTRRRANQTAREVTSHDAPRSVLGTRHGFGSFDFGPDVRRLVLHLLNVGSGPAFDVQVLLQPWSKAPEPWDYGAVPPGQHANVVFEGVTLPGPWPADVGVPQWTMRAEVQYRDLADRVLTVSFDIERLPQGGAPAADRYRLAATSFGSPQSG